MHIQYYMYPRLPKYPNSRRMFLEKGEKGYLSGPFSLLLSVKFAYPNTSGFNWFSQVSCLFLIISYCWWTKSCTTKDDNYPIIYRVLTIPGGAGFLPSTVWGFRWVFFFWKDWGQGSKVVFFRWKNLTKRGVRTLTLRWFWNMISQAPPMSNGILVGSSSWCTFIAKMMMEYWILKGKMCS